MLTLTPTHRTCGAESTLRPRAIPARTVDWDALERHYLTPQRLSIALDRLIDELAAELWPGVKPVASPRPHRHRPARPLGRSPGRTAASRR